MWAKLRVRGFVCSSVDCFDGDRPIIQRGAVDGFDGLRGFGFGCRRAASNEGEVRKAAAGATAVAGEGNQLFVEGVLGAHSGDGLTFLASSPSLPLSHHFWHHFLGRR